MKRQNITKLQELPTEGSLTDRTRERNALGLIAFLLFLKYLMGSTVYPIKIRCLVGIVGFAN